MNADDLIQELSIAVYRSPLSGVRHETDYPRLGNPLHLVVLLIDCDTEIDMNGVLGFLENRTGGYLSETIEAMELIGAIECAAIFRSIQDCMTKYSVTWERLRGDFEGTTEFQITSFSELHGEGLHTFAIEVGELTRHFSVFSRKFPGNAYGAVCNYLDNRLGELRREIDKRTQ